MTSLRELTELDLENVVEINNAGYPAVPLATLEEIRSLYELSSYRMAALNDQGEVVGFALALDPGADYDSENYVFFESRFENHLYIDRIVFADSARGLGLGTALYENLFDFAKAQGRTAVTCEVNLEPPNPGSLRFHRRFGFENVDTQATKGGAVVVQLLQAPLA
jgi:predicted GNAT superfamily acetyltransferase